MIVGLWRISRSEWEKRLLSVNARVLDPPQLEFAEKNTVTPIAGRWNAPNEKVYRSGEALTDRWAYLSFSSLDQKELSGFGKALQEQCKNTGMDFEGTPHLFQRGVISEGPKRKQSVCTSLSKMHAAAVQKDKDIKLLIVVLPDGMSSEVYKEIKRICDTVLVMSQCIAPTFAKNPSRLGLESVGQKINMKVGGINWMPILQISTEDSTPTIIFGADVSHPETNATGISIAAVTKNPQLL